MGEIGRRVVHASGVGVPTLYLLGLLQWDHIRVLLVLGTCVALVLEVLRLKLGFDLWIYRQLTRPYEQETVAGYALYMISITFVALVFSAHIAVPAMLMLMLGDPISGYLGSGEPRKIKRPRSLVAMFIVSSIVALPFMLGVLNTWIAAILAAAMGGSAATIADGVTVRLRGKIVDDNLSIPVMAGVTLWLALILLSEV